MPRIPRINVDNAVYYITSKGSDDEAIFKDEKDYRAYLELLRKYKEQLGFKLFSFTLLPNCLHLLIEPKEGVNMSQIMHALNSSYTKYFNSRYDKKGHLFQERYKMVILEKGPYILIVSAYIHLTPRASGLSAIPDEYAYSSCKALLDSGSRRPFGIDIEEEAKEIEQMLEESNSYKTYGDVIKDASSEKAKEIGDVLNKKAIVGSAEFLEKVKLKAESDRIEGARDEKTEEKHRRLLVAGGVAISVLLIFIIFLYARTSVLDNIFRKKLASEESNMAKSLARDRERIRKDLEEKYRADQVSYQAMSKRMKIEEQKVKELQEKVKE